jgi:hypothetical protein
MGRPTIVDDLVVNKLEEAFAFGCSDEEACIYADISKQTLYNFQDKNQEFLDRKQLLKSRPILLARQAVLNGFNSNPNLALKFLERRKRDEFDPKQEPKDTLKPITINIISQADYASLDEQEKSSRLFINEVIAKKYEVGI